MEFSIYFYLTLMFLSPWPVFFSLIFYYGYKFDRNFEYYISKNKQLYKFWAAILLLPIIFSSIFLLRYKRIGLSINLLYIKDGILTVIYSLSYIDLTILLVFFCQFIITWILALRLLYQYFRKCLLALYLYYLQYQKFYDLCYQIVLLHWYYIRYLSIRVKIFTSHRKIIALTRLIWPFTIDITERNLFRCILPYLIIFDFIVHQGVISKLFLILPWYYVYSLVRFGLKFFFAIHKIENWNISEEMYGNPK